MIAHCSTSHEGGGGGSAPECASHNVPQSEASEKRGHSQYLAVGPPSSACDSLHNAVSSESATATTGVDGRHTPTPVSTPLNLGIFADGKTIVDQVDFNVLLFKDKKEGKLWIEPLGTEPHADETDGTAISSDRTECQP